MATFNLRCLASPAGFTAVLFTLIASLPLATATFTIARCCTLAVRTEFHKYYDEHYPWEVCNFNKEIDYATNETFPSIMKPMSWAKQFCRGTQYSDTKQWLQPLAAYISPYIGLLLLCPVGKEERSGTTGQRPLERFVRALWSRAREYIGILGDPASVVFGAASEVYADTVALSSISSLSAERQRATWVAALAGALEFSSQTDWRRDHAVEQLQPATSEWKPQLEMKSTAAAAGREVESIDPANVNTPSPLPGTDSDYYDEETTRAIALCIAARPSFVTAILIPVVLMLAVTAATFYDAYAKRGDKDTGLALAYCVWYSWIIVPAVAGNCFATVLSPDVARRAFRKVMDFGKGERAIVALRDRHVNNQFWGSWVEARDGGAKGFAEFAEGLRGDVWFWVRFCGGQVMGWCCVAVACGAAGAIAWTTPTVGLGCRSFNFLLYGILAFVNGLLHVLCSWLSVRDKSKRADEQGRPGGPGSRLSAKLTLADGVRAVYWFLVFANSMVMVVGTLLHLVGVFRTCWCDRLTWNDDTMIELNSKTPEAVQNANRYWISTSYVVFSIMTLACLPAVILRQVIARRMDEWIEAEEARGDEK
jgi:hypothetical protein